MSEEKGLLIGIDLGTTNSLVAVMRDGRAEVLPNSLGELLTPSAVRVEEGGRLLVGAAARFGAAKFPEQTALSFKRDMGTERQYRLGDGNCFSATELSALVLRQLREDVEDALGTPVREVVVTVPAYFGELQRRATRDACELAGLRVDRIINEPTAAALAYGLHQQDREFQAIVIDLGGGTFDVSVMNMMEGVVEIQSTSGDMKLGGDDFDELLVQHCVDVIETTHGWLLGEDRGALARLRAACEEAKRRLGRADEACVVLPGLVVGGRAPVDVSIPLEREAVEQLWSGLLVRMRQPIQRALSDAGIQAEDVEEVLLVGGATRMPCVVKLAAQFFGRLPTRGLPPDEAIALGAAIQAALKADDASVQDLVVTDVAPFSLGVAISTQVGTRTATGIFSPILERGTVLPASRTGTYYPIEEGQRTITLEIFQGEHSLCRSNALLGELHVKGITDGPDGSAGVEVRFTYDLNGLLDVDATVLATGKTVSTTIENMPGQMSPAQLKKARAAMERLKFHPREALPNTAALEEADALHVELIGEPRKMLAELIGHFRVSLNSEDMALIQISRARLRAFVASHRHDDGELD